MTEVYKVVRRTSLGTLESALVFPYNKLCTWYRTDKWAKAPVGGLLVFEDYQSALRFVEASGKYPDWEIWLADAYRPIRLPEKKPWTVRMEDLRQCWQTKKVNGFYSTKWPSGTRAYKFVRLKRRLAP